MAMVRRRRKRGHDERYPTNRFSHSQSASMLLLSVILLSFRAATTTAFAPSVALTGIRERRSNYDNRNVRVDVEQQRRKRLLFFMARSSFNRRKARDGGGGTNNEDKTTRRKNRKSPESNNEDDGTAPDGSGGRTTRNKGGNGPNFKGRRDASIFGAINGGESSLLPPSPPSPTDRNDHQKRIQMRRGKDNNRRYYQLRNNGNIKSNSDDASPTGFSNSNRQGGNGMSPRSSAKLRPYASPARQQAQPYSYRFSRGSSSSGGADSSSSGARNRKSAGEGASPDFSSLLPPPLSESIVRGPRSSTNDDDDRNERDGRNTHTFSDAGSGLSSWEDFLGTASPLMNTYDDEDDDDSIRPLADSKGDGNNKRTPASVNSSSSLGGDSSFKTRGSLNESTKKDANLQQRLPDISDLFPTSLSSPLSVPEPLFKAARRSDTMTRVGHVTSSRPLEGVLPVSDLFYHASSSAPKNPSATQDSSGSTLSTATTTSSRYRNLNTKSSEMEESASSSMKSTGSQQQQSQPSREQPEINKKTGKRKKTGRKMVRRGMEMLVGGVPISADPPLRAVELYYNNGNGISSSDERERDGGEEEEEDPDRSIGVENSWKSVITLNTPDFGPLLCRKGVSKVSKLEEGLFCEFFVQSTIKWGVCPKDLMQIAQSYNKEQQPFSQNIQVKRVNTGAKGKAGDGSAMEEEDDDDPFHKDRAPTHDEEDEEDGMLSVMLRPHRTIASEANIACKSSNISKPLAADDDDEDLLYEFHIGTIEVNIGVQKDLLEPSSLEDNDDDGSIMKSVLTDGVQSAVGDRLDGAKLEISHFALSSDEDGSSTSKVAADFVVRCSVSPGASDEEIVDKAKKLVAVFAEASEGDISLAAANAARQETRWKPEVRDRVAEEFLDEDDDDDDEHEGDESSSDDDDSDGDEDYEDDGDDEDGGDYYGDEESGQIRGSASSDGKGNMRGSDLFLRDSGLILPSNSLEIPGASGGGFYYDYSAANAPFAPYRGEIGLRLVDAVVERAKARHPRVIAIGDVHGCIDELQELLRQCDYRPGDLVVFLGDLVCKGPDSISVVQMAREIGAIGVRGNHDFEVIRWHRAIRAGVDPPALRSEHFHIASCLTKADVKWMYSLPWYMSSKDLGTLFVHAGFVSGIRLAKQNPRLMMNMRSILPDGTVTSKFFNNWPWARLWDGPQTVLFGHDADRGLQQYEHAIGLDTGCVYGGRLTACILPERRLVSVSARREYFKYRRKHYD